MHERWGDWANAMREAVGPDAIGKGVYLSLYPRLEIAGLKLHIPYLDLSIILC